MPGARHHTATPSLTLPFLPPFHALPQAPPRPGACCWSCGPPKGPSGGQMVPREQDRTLGYWGLQPEQWLRGQGKEASACGSWRGVAIVPLACHFCSFGGVASLQNPFFILTIWICVLFPELQVLIFCYVFVAPSCLRNRS